MENKHTIEELRRRIRQHWPETATPETEFILGLIRLNDVIASRTNEITGGFGLTPAGFETLVTLRSLPEPRQLTPNELQKSILVTSGGMTKVLHQLEANGWIERTSHGQDKRSKLVKLTASGKARIEDCMTAVQRGDRNLLTQSLSDKEISKLRDLILLALEKIE
jgi:DNA-binding MarR family transcriptional regulator